MQLLATKDNVIFKVKEKVKDPSELLVDTGEKETVLIGEHVASGGQVSMTFHKEDEVCAYVNRVAVLPWAIEGYTFYTVKEENIYAVKRNH